MYERSIKLINCAIRARHSAGWSSLVARRAHNPKVVGSNPAPATTCNSRSEVISGLLFLLVLKVLLALKAGVVETVGAVEDDAISSVVDAVGAELDVAPSLSC